MTSSKIVRAFIKCSNGGIRRPTKEPDLLTVLERPLAAAVTIQPRVVDMTQLRQGGQEGH